MLLKPISVCHSPIISSKKNFHVLLFFLQKQFKKNSEIVRAQILDNAGFCLTRNFLKVRLLVAPWKSGNCSAIPFQKFKFKSCSNPARNLLQLEKLRIYCSGRLEIMQPRFPGSGIPQSIIIIIRINIIKF